MNVPDVLMAIGACSSVGCAFGFTALGESFCACFCHEMYLNLFKFYVEHIQGLDSARQREQKVEAEPLYCFLKKMPASGDNLNVWDKLKEYAKEIVSDEKHIETFLTEATTMNCKRSQGRFHACLRRIFCIQLVIVIIYKLYQHWH